MDFPELFESSGSEVAFGDSVFVPSFSKLIFMLCDDDFSKLEAVRRNGYRDFLYFLRVRKSKVEGKRLKGG